MSDERIIVVAPEELKAMELIEQVEYINNIIEHYGSLTKGCEAIGINRSTIQKRFRSNGYKFDKDLNKYVFLEDVVVGDTNLKGSKALSEGHLSEVELLKLQIQALTKENAKLKVENTSLSNKIEHLEAKVESNNTTAPIVDKIVDIATAPIVDKIVDIATVKPTIPPINKGGRPSPNYDRIKELYLDGYSYNQITQYLGCNYSTVAKNIKKIKAELGL